MFLYFVMTVLITASVAAACGHKHGDTTWVKMNKHDVCLRARGDRYGSFRNYIYGGLVIGIKLEYISGEVRCLPGVKHNSRWGCKGYRPFEKFPLNIVVTDNFNNVLFPKQEYIKHAAGLWYWSPFVSSTHSDEIIFTDYRMPFFFPKNKEMRIWFGEDLQNWTDFNNAGRVCVNVYAKFRL